MSAVTPRRLKNYELLTELGRGGMAELYAARLIGVGGFTTLVAIKLILPHLSQDKLFVELFLNEGRIAGQLSHPNVCRVYELGEVDGQLYLAMDYLDGVVWEDLASLLPPDPVSAFRLAIGVLAQACDGLHYAHELRDANGAPTPVVHRDVSPQNLFVTIHGECKVLDFGVSKMLTDGKLTRTGVVKGKFPYMAPEQIRGERVDPRADVFAAGVVLWEALTHERLFDRSTEFLIYEAITKSEIPKISTSQPAYGADVDLLVMRALERDRADRYPTIGAFADEMRRVATAYGGAAGMSEIAELVRATCGAKIEERARAIAAAVNALSAPVFETIDPQPSSSATASMAMRAESIVVQRGSRHRWSLMLGLVLLAAIAAVLVAMWPARALNERAKPVAPRPRDAAPLTDDVVVIDAAGAIPPVAVDARTRVPDRSHDRPRDRSRAARETQVQDAAAGAGASASPGWLSVDSNPYAVIYIDGVQLAGTTPIYRRKLAPGRHELRAVSADGREQRRTVVIESEKEISLGTLSW